MSLDASPRTHRFISTDILTSGYRVVGKTMVTSHGAMGILNDPTHSSLDVNDARLARLHMPTKLVDHFEVVRMMKRQIHAVCLSRREDLGPQALVRGGYSHVVEYSVRIVTQVFEVEGMMELPGRFDFAAIMADGTRDFLPVFNATLTAILIPNVRVESAGILVNRKVIDIMALQNHRVKPEN
ncbi:MAG: hypothetical protein QY328_15935 [Anaerolineales bacterium]|jgi:hypothetical protein|nr:hypothetical protein [Anaerolineales bacterium]WKZ39749.1 MAG: hypothetical protein QY328_15935 [Anaerolineales bacterium]